MHKISGLLRDPQLFDVVTENLSDTFQICKAVNVSKVQSLQADISKEKKAISKNNWATILQKPLKVHSTRAVTCQCNDTVTFRLLAQSEATMLTGHKLLDSAAGLQAVHRGQKSLRNLLKTSSLWAVWSIIYRECNIFNGITSKEGGLYPERECPTPWCESNRGLSSTVITKYTVTPVEKKKNLRKIFNPPETRESFHSQQNMI